MSAIGLASRGYVDSAKRFVPGPQYLEHPHPDAQTETLRPEIMAKADRAPKVKLSPSRPVRPAIRPRRRTRQRAAKGAK